MKFFSHLLFGLSSMFFLFSCSKSELEIDFQAKKYEDYQDFVKRNATVVLELQEFILENK